MGSDFHPRRQNQRRRRLFRLFVRKKLKPVRLVRSDFHPRQDQRRRRLFRLFVTKKLKPVRLLRLDLAVITTTH